LVWFLVFIFVSHVAMVSLVILSLRRADAFGRAGDNGDFAREALVLCDHGFIL